MTDHPDTSPRWKHDGVRVIPGNQLDANTAQTPGMDRQAAINFARVGAQKLWAGTVTILPDAKTAPHVLGGEPFVHPDAVAGDRRHALKVMAINRTSGKVLWERLRSRGMSLIDHQHALMPLSQFRNFHQGCKIADHAE